MANSTIIVNTRNILPAKPLFQGLNLQWQDNGDGLVDVTDKIRFNDVSLNSVKMCSPKMLRYPGGTESITYDWRASVNDNLAMANRQFVARPYPGDAPQKPYFGLSEYLQLCKTVGATPLYTVNIFNKVNDTLALIDKIRESYNGTICLEIGNEPYLNQPQPQQDLNAAQFASVITPLLKRLLQPKPAGVKIGLPVRSDLMNGVPITPYAGFTWNYLLALKQAGIPLDKIDFASIHTGYLPYFVADWPEDKARVAITLNSPQMLIQDVKYTQNVLTNYRMSPDIYMTEFAPVFTLQGEHDYDAHSLLGALYTFECLRTMLVDTTIRHASLWSAPGNYVWGLLDTARKPLNTYRLYERFAPMLDGQLLKVDITTDKKLVNDSYVYVGSQSTPSVSALASIKDRVVRLLILNKLDETNNIKVTGGGTLRKFQELAANSVFSLDTQSWSNTDFIAGQTSVSLLPLSLTYLELA